MSQKRKNSFFILGFFILLGLSVACFIFQHISLYEKYVYSLPNDVPQSSVALVFGAGIRPNGKPSDVLSDRVMTAVELYRLGKVQKLLMSGDNGTKTYDEVSVMKEFAMKYGVKSEDITLDYAGFDTYDTCYRAKEIFGLQKDVVLVTQGFHLPRALYTCRRLGITSIGIRADKHVYLLNMWGLREFLARSKAWLEVEVVHSKPKFLGKKENIFK